MSAAVLAAVLCLAVPRATLAQGAGYAWANNPTASDYTPSAAYSHNPSGEEIRVERSDTGAYRVTFAGLGGRGSPGGHAQVTAYGPGSESCKILRWSSGGEDFTVEVRCFSSTGEAADARFTVFVTWPAGTTAEYPPEPDAEERDTEERETPGPSGPATHSSGRLEISQTWTADLDEGAVPGEAQADIWFEAVTPSERYVTPVNGASIAGMGAGFTPTRDGCADAPLATSKIAVEELPPRGRYVCLRTNEGRYAVFTVLDPVGPPPGELRIGYTTWENP